MIHAIEGLTVVNEDHENTSVLFDGLFDNPAHVGDLVTCTTTFSETCLCWWEFTIEVVFQTCCYYIKKNFARV